MSPYVCQYAMTALGVWPSSDVMYFLGLVLPRALPSEEHDTLGWNNFHTPKAVVAQLLYYVDVKGNLAVYKGLFCHIHIPKPVI